MKAELLAIRMQLIDNQLLNRAYKINVFAHNRHLLISIVRS